MFGSKYSTSQLNNNGCRDWKNLGKKLKSYEISNEHIINMIRWIELEKRLSKNKEKEH